MQGRIQNKEAIAQGTLQVTFQLNQPITFKPGQYCFITLNGIKKQFSINNSPSQSKILTITTRLSDSDFKKTLNALPVGGEVELGPIAGMFTLPLDTNKPLVFIAGGIGITPFMSMLQFIQENKINYKITLVYANRNQASTAYQDRLQALAEDLPGFKLILTMTEDTEWAGETRKIDSQFIKEYFPQVNDYSYMVVGPPAMVEAVENALRKAHVDQVNIKTENFTGY